MAAGGEAASEPGATRMLAAATGGHKATLPAAIIRTGTADRRFSPPLRAVVTDRGS